MYPSEFQFSSDILAYHKELQRQMHRNSQQELCPVKRLNRKSIFSKAALPLAKLMIVSGQQIQARYQLA